MKLFKRDIYGKIVKMEELAVICGKIKKSGRTISCTSGTFDILHDGHIKYLMRAAEFGDVLVVGIDEDSLVKKFKGDSRPKLPGYVRILNIAAHEHVDIACLITCSREMIKIVRPNILLSLDQPAIFPKELKNSISSNLSEERSSLCSPCPPCLQRKLSGGLAYEKNPKS